MTAEKNYTLMDCVRAGRILDSWACPSSCPHLTAISPYSHCESLIVAIATQSLGACTQEDVAELMGWGVREVAAAEESGLVALADGRAAALRALADDEAKRRAPPPREGTEACDASEAETAAAPTTQGTLIDTGAGQRHRPSHGRRTLTVIQPTAADAAPDSQQQTIPGVAA